MEVFKTKDPDVFVIFDSESPTKDKRLYETKITDLNSRLEVITVELAELPVITDEYLLTCAKENHPESAEVEMQKNLETEKIEIETILDLTKVLK